jgi:hypothetical protein
VTTTRTRSRRSVWASLALAAALAAVPARPAGGWNPLDAIVGAGRAVGSVFGSPFGGAIEAATAPTIASAEGSGHRLVADLDGRLGAQVERLGGVATSAIAGVDRAAAARIDQIDDRLGARILQLQNVGDELFGQVRTTVAEVDADVQRRLAQVDGILARREDQLGRIVSSTVAQADEAIAARLDQADEIVGKRIGNVDVIATKQGLNLEGSVLKVGTLLAMVVLVAFILWRLWVEIATKWNPDLPTARNRMARAVSLSWPRILGQVAFAAAGALTLYLLSDRLTIGPRKARAALTELHVKGLESAARAFDLTRAHYHAAQLELLDDDAQAAQGHRAVVLKAELLRDVFVRATILRTYDGVREVMRRVDALERLHPGDADVLVVKAHVLWQVGQTRAAEAEAAKIAAEALTSRTPRLGGFFVLEPLARHYLWLALRLAPPRPGQDGAADSLRAALGAPAPAAPFPPLEHVFAYDRLVDALDREAAPAYVAMVRADAELHAAPDAGARPKLLEVRRIGAGRVVEAWRRFDEGLRSNGWLASSTAVLAAFQLNDATLSHARWFVARPETLEPPPVLSRAAGRPAGAVPPELRMAVAPLRVTLARRYARLLGPHLGDVVAYEEARRFEDYERGTLAFEQAMREYVQALRARAPGTELPGAARRAAVASARLGLHLPHGGRERAHAEVLLEEAGLRDVKQGAAALPPDVAEALTLRTLRFL